MTRAEYENTDIIQALDQCAPGQLLEQTDLEAFLARLGDSRVRVARVGRGCWGIEVGSRGRTSL